MAQTHPLGMTEEELCGLLAAGTDDAAADVLWVLQVREAYITQFEAILAQAAGEAGAPPAAGAAGANSSS